jgi:nucleoside-diphosphate-sugar epimerase
MRILVTGATGLIGCHAAAELVRCGQEVRLLVRDPAKVDRVFAPFGLASGDFDLRVGDLLDPEALGRGLEGCQGLLHCAGIFSPERRDEARLVETNVEGTRRVLEAGRAAGLDRAVYVSSMLALFPPRGSTMRADDEVARPSSMYAITKADAERVARALQREMPLTIVYPAAVQGPDDPTFSVGPELVARALEQGEVLVTSGGLAYTDVRDLARVVVKVFTLDEPPARLMAPSFFVSHADYHALLEEISGRRLRARRIPGWLMRALGRMGDGLQRLGRDVQLTYEAAEVLTRSVPLDDSEARRLLETPPISPRDSFSDLVDWMVAAGHLSAEKAGPARQG